MENSNFFCFGCGKPLSDKALACPNCGAPQKTATPSNNQNDSLKYILPVGRSGWAIAAGYLAFFSILVIPAPFALLCGIIALRDISKNPEKIGKGRAWFGIIMGALVILTVALIRFSRGS